MKRSLSKIFSMIMAISACAPIGPGPGPHPPADPVPGYRPPPSPPRLSFDAIDVNSDGRISRHEFVTANIPAPPREPMPDRDEMFDRIDLDNDSLITRAELDEYRERPH